MMAKRKDDAIAEVEKEFGGNIVDVKPEPKVNKEYTLEIVKDYDGSIDIWHLSNKDPNYEYRWLRYEEKNLSMKTSNYLHDRGGWQICPKEHLLRLKIIRGEKELHPDGTLRRGENVLAFMPKDLYKSKEEKKRKIANDRMDSIRRMVKKGDQKPGVHSSMKGLQTAGDLGMGTTGNISVSSEEEG
jgi:hypothetical protein